MTAETFPAREDLIGVGVTCAALSVRKAARALTQFYDNILAPSGIGIAQFGLMVAIEFRGMEPRAELARVLVMDRTTVARNLKLLERDGFIETVPGDDRRTRAVRLTQAGRDALTRTLPYWRQAQDRSVDFVGNGEWQTTHASLRAMEALYEA